MVVFVQTEHFYRVSEQAPTSRLFALIFWGVLSVTRGYGSTIERVQ